MPKGGAEADRLPMLVAMTSIGGGKTGLGLEQALRQGRTVARVVTGPGEEGVDG